MDLMSILWLLVAACALVFAGDALLAGVVRRPQMPADRRHPNRRFGALMLLFALGCIAMAVIDPTTITVSRSSLH